MSLRAPAVSLILRPVEPLGLHGGEGGLDIGEGEGPAGQYVIHEDFAVEDDVLMERKVRKKIRGKEREIRLVF